MTSRIPTELEKKIILRLENEDDRNEIILDLCISQDLDWKEAESIVESIQAENIVDITLEQSPVLVTLALVIFLGGVGLISFTAYNAVSMYKTIYLINNTGLISDPSGWESVRGFLIYLVMTGEQYFGSLILGIGMIIGSLKGMEDVWTAIFAKLGVFQGG